MEENYELFFKMSKRTTSENKLSDLFSEKKRAKEKFKQMSVHTYNALKELKEKSLDKKAKEQGTFEELKNFYKENVEDNSNRSYDKIEYDRLYLELRKK